LHFILTNPFYTGRTLGADGSYVQSVSHQSLVSNDLFETVQKMLKKKRVSIHYAEKLDLPFRGMVRCTDCGRVYTPYIKKGIQYFGARCAKSCPTQRRASTRH